jgi:hypothetical protein
MKRFILVFLSLILLLQGFAPAVPIAAQTPGPAQKVAVLCLPGVYLAPSDCSPSGPSDYLTRMARLGLTYPLPPLPGQKADPQLITLPFSYAMLDGNAGEIYSTLDDALAGNSPVSEIGKGKLKFISYVDTANPSGGKPEAFNLRSGGWMSSRDIAARWGVVPSFQGRTFQTTPLGSFGWVNAIQSSIETMRIPSYDPKNKTGHVLSQYQAVRAYGEQQALGTTWVMVGADEWVEKRYIGRVIPNPTPPKGVIGGRWIEINLYEQTLMVYDQDRLVFATLIATGMEPFWTRPGLFQIKDRLTSTLMSGAFEADKSDFYYLQDVPWTMYYDEARALHGAYWRTRFGFPQSHGCVNLSPGDAHWLFNWAHAGDWVYVWDPSGQTPIDPKFYSQGGA